MRIVLCIAVGTFALLGVPATAHAWGWPCQVNCDRCFHWGFSFSCGPTFHLGPWYVYYPYAANFQAPAPVGPYPNWQTPVVAAVPGAPVSPPVPAAPAPMPWQPPAPQPATQPLGYVQPTAFSYPQQVPSYWYGQR